MGFQVNNESERPLEEVYRAPIVFFERDFETVIVPHAKILVIKLRISNAIV